MVGTREYFSKPDVALDETSPIAIFTAHNEADRIPFFLDYYRKHGISHFFAIDNNSTDGTRELLAEQKDVSYFFTPSSYVESKAGRLWTSELANHYGNGRWCLTLDLDELLVYPGSEHVSIAQLCNYLDQGGYDGLFCVFLDMYSSKPLSEAIYSPGQSFLEVCDHFEVDGYILRQPMHFPHVQVFGGPRQRIFWEQGNRGMGPSMRKTPLVKWRQGFKYIYSTHSSTPIRLADITGGLLHFKFFSSFKSLAARELARGERVQKDHYEQYARLTTEQDISFMTPASRRYESSVTLVEHGVIVCTKRYLAQVRHLLLHELGQVRAKDVEDDLRSAMNTAAAAAVLKLSQLPLLWPMLGSNVNCGLLGVRGSTITGWYSNLAASTPYTWIEARIDGKTVARARTGDSLWPEADVDVRQRNFAFMIPIPDEALAASPRTAVSLFAAGEEQPFVAVTLSQAGRISLETDIDGVCQDNDRGRIRGWALDKRDVDRKAFVSLFVDGRFWCRVTADQYGEDLERKAIGDGWHRFHVDVPDALMDGMQHSVDVIFGGTNCHLRRSPLIVQGEKIYWPKQG